MSSESRPVDALALPPSSLLPFKRAGYELLDEIPTQSAEELSQGCWLLACSRLLRVCSYVHHSNSPALKIPLGTSQSLLSASQWNATPAQPLMQSAASLASRRRGTTVTKYQTHFAPLDKLLDGGIPRGHILELSGPPGTPKEKIALGVVRSFLDSKEEVLFVDFQNMTRPTMMKETLGDMPNYEKLLSYLKMSTLVDLMIFIHNLSSYVLGHPTTTLLVLNSISFPFQSTTDLKTSVKSSLFDQIKQALLHSCAAHNLTVVITSQLATKLFNADGSPGNFDTGAKGVLVPQLGPSYLPAGRSYRVILARDSFDTGIVRMFSSPTQKTTTAAMTEPFSMFGV
ncbi:hypothetical protein V5O48_005938 [Marasmius crinis-equi]|uniref:RecA family profile 1 domain-containing protein n=1 Tax=Marasmius crinis-equi TaxID=585013 RepID=A0ABR3FLR4_9AGAR